MDVGRTGLPLSRICVGTWGENRAAGSLIAVGVWIDEQSADALAQLSIRDAASLTPGEAASWGRRLLEVVPCEVVKLKPRKYNALWRRFGSRDRVLNFCYLKAIEVLMDCYPDTCAVTYSITAPAFAVLAGEIRPRGDIDLIYLSPSGLPKDQGINAAEVLARAHYDRELGALLEHLGLASPETTPEVIESVARDQHDATWMEPLINQWGHAGIFRLFKRDTDIAEQALASR